MVLGSVLERGFSTEAAVAAMTRWLAGKPMVPWLTQPKSRATLTLLDVQPLADRPSHKAAIRQWADAVLVHWSIHHATVRRWLDAGHPG